MTEAELIEKQARAAERAMKALEMPEQVAPSLKVLASICSTAALAAIREAGVATVRRDDLERVREILWERGESETEHGPLWLVRTMLAAGDDA